MIDLLFDPVAGIARAASPIIFKAGADVRVRITMTPPPGDVSGLELSIISGDADASRLAFTDALTADSDRVWSGLLDSNDTRLITFLAGKASVPVAVELRATVDGVQSIAPNITATAQRAAAGTAASEGGPTYYTAAQTDAAIAVAVGAIAGTTFTDGVTADVYRLVVNNGVLGLELVP